MLQPRCLFPPGLILLLLSLPLCAQQKSKIDLEPNETVFSVLAALNTCGYDTDLVASDPVRMQVRQVISRTIEKSSEAAQATQQLCSFYRDHRSEDPTRDFSQYISLALNLSAPPEFKLKVKEADMPPDASYVLGFAPLVARFYTAAGLEQVWRSVLPKYEAEVEKVHEPLANMMLTTDVYLKMPISGYVGRQFVVNIDPLAGPGLVNARNYGDDYYIVASLVNGTLPMDNVRHTYLHFVLDPLASKHPVAMRRLDPILKDLESAPMDDAYKHDTAMLVTECLIRAIEARFIPGGKAAEPKREQEVKDDVRSGFVLTDYFYDVLVKFENDPVGLRTAFPDWMFYMDISKQRKLARETQFTANPRGEVVKSASAKTNLGPLELAEEKIRERDLDGAQKLALEVASKNGADSARAYLILGQVATLNRDRDSAIKYFEQTIRLAKEPRLIAWSHIYLGRIYDVEQERDLAVKHYQAALQAGDDAPQTKAAAEKGLHSEYERPTSSDQEKQ